MDFKGFYHENKSKYAYAVDLHTMHIRLRTGRDDVSKVTLVVFDPYEWNKTETGEYALTGINELNMNIEQTTRYHDWWFATAPIPTKRTKYGFIVENGDEKYLYGPGGETPYKAEDGSIVDFIRKSSHLCYLYPYILEADLFNPPKWVENTIWYQIFPERYANSGLETLRKGELLPWGSQEKVNNSHLYGGDLPGITAHLDDIKDLGFNGIYMTPIFAATTTHKYDTEDYYQIDPAFGDHRLFRELVDEAHKRGIRIMIDLVFNHIGHTHPFWLDVVANGTASRYYNWFWVREDGTYETFAKVKAMPKWNTDNPEAREYLINVALYWAQSFDIDGFRLDVANEVSHDFWREFRTRLRKVNPQIYILGEVWDNGISWLGGDQFDAVMNYPLTTAIWNYVSGDVSGTALKEEIANSLVMYPRNRQSVMFNLIGSHDTSRILTLCKGRPELVKQAFTLLLTMPGSPMCFYGDEVGLAGDGMDDTRKCMIWDDAKRDKDLEAFVCKLNNLRTANDDMRTIEVEWIQADSKAVVYKKGRLVVVLNCQDTDATILLPTDMKVYDLINDCIITHSKLEMPNYGVCILTKMED